MSNVIDVEEMVWKQIREYRSAARVHKYRTAARIHAKTIATIRLPRIREDIKNPAMLRAIDEIIEEDARIRLVELADRIDAGIEHLSEPLERIFSASESSCPEEISSVRPVKVFFCLKGRNAWHSKWVRRYTQNCVFASLKAARDFAEKQRRQGNVFYISELPALRINTENESFVLTEINTDVPLNRLFSIVSFITGLSMKKEVFATLDEFFHAAEQVERKQGHLLAFKTNRDTFFETIQEDQTGFETWRSASVGAEYRLDWQFIDSGGDASAITELASIFHAPD